MTTIRTSKNTHTLGWWADKTAPGTMDWNRETSFLGETIEVMKPDGRNLLVKVKGMMDEEGNVLESGPDPKQKIYVDLGVELNDFDLLRRRDNG